MECGQIGADGYFGIAGQSYRKKEVSFQFIRQLRTSGRQYGNEVQT